MLEITISSAAWTNDMQEKMDNLPMQEVGDLFLRDIDGRFAEHNWPAKKDGSPATLIDTGALKEAINQIVFQDEVRIEPPMEYSSYLQEGTKHMPAREFFPTDLSSIDQVELQGIFDKHFTE